MQYNNHIENRLYAYGVACFRKGCDASAIGGIALQGYTDARLQWLTENSAMTENSAKAEIQQKLKTSDFRHGIDETRATIDALGRGIGWKSQQWGMDIIPIG
jgi:hypothetical protein